MASQGHTDKQWITYIVDWLIYWKTNFISEHATCVKCGPGPHLPIDCLHCSHHFCQLMIKWSLVSNIRSEHSSHVISKLPRSADDLSISHTFFETAAIDNSFLDLPVEVWSDTQSFKDATDLIGHLVSMMLLKEVWHLCRTLMHRQRTRHKCSICYRSLRNTRRTSQTAIVMNFFRCS